jgi:hypothetical protein
MKDTVNVRIDRALWEIIGQEAQRETRSATAQLDVTLRASLPGAALPVAARREPEQPEKN